MKKNITAQHGNHYVQIVAFLASANMTVVKAVFIRGDGTLGTAPLNEFKAAELA